MAERSLVYSLIGRDQSLGRTLKKAGRDTQRFTRETNRAGSSLKAAFATFSAAAVVVEMGRWVAAARDANRVAAQTDAVIRSTHGAAGLSARGFSDLARQISKTAAVDDDLVQSGANILATFTKIKAGGPDRIFERTEVAAVDMTAALNQGQVTAEGLKSANLVLGKALQDPIAGLGKLQRVGVSFSEQQKQQIADFVKHGQVAKAQGVILAEVNREFGGSAAAAVTPAKRLAVTWGNMQETLGNLLIPALDRGASVMAGFLEVVDHNRVAFGILFGVLAAGAAIVGTLIVAEKVHRAVVDASKVASAAWATVQKGLNLILGVTRVQAVTTAAAETELAAATAAAGNSAAAAGTKFALFGRLSLASLGLFTAGVGLGVVSVAKFAETVKKGDSENQKFGGTVQLGTKFGGLYAGAQDKAAAAQRGANTAVAASIPLQGQAAERTAAITQKTGELTGKLDSLKTAFKAQTDSVRDSITAYEGLITQSEVTAGQVVTDLHNQVSNFKTYSSDVKRLIKAGVSPAAIQELSQKGPQYVHALATGSNAELVRYKKFWRDRQAEIKGSFAASMQRQYEGLVAKIRAMQKAIDRLTGKNVDISATTSLHFTKSFSQKDWLDARLAAGRAAKGLRITKGTGPTADDVPIWASKGETVVSAADSSDPWFQRFATAKGIPGFAQGGAVGINNTGRAHAGVGRIMDRAGTLQVAALVKALVSGGGSAAIKAFIRSTDALPYIWGAAGPGGYDCSGLAGAVALAHRGKAYGHGQRVWTTSSIHPGILGLQSGLGGTLQIGVTAGTGHMAGRYGGLGFEAASSRTGIKVGASARRPETFARRFHMAKGGKINPTLVASLAQAGLDIGGDQGRLRVNGKVFDHGGTLAPGLNLVANRTGRPEPLAPVVAGGDVHVHVTLSGAILLTDQRALKDLATRLEPKMRQAMIEAQRRGGVPAAGQLR
jgi:hypothetical protein